MTIDQKLCDIEIEEIRDIGKGGNVCLIFQSFKKGYCMLTGIYSRALFLIPLAKKVNAGCVSSYVLCKDYKTKYLNELKQGDEILALDKNGGKSLIIVKRSKIKSWPMILVKGNYKISGNRIFDLLRDNGEDYFNDYRDIFHLKERKTGNLINVLDLNGYKNRKNDICAYLDVATITPDYEKNFIMCDDGASKFVKQLKKRDRILAYIQMPKLNSRHFGMKYEGLCLER